MRFEFKHLPVPASREEAKRKAQQHKEACKKMAFQQYFTNLKADMEEKRKNFMKTGSSSSSGSGWGAPREDRDGSGPREDGGGGGGGPREDGGGGGPRRDPFMYFTKAVPSNSFTAFEHGVNF